MMTFPIDFDDFHKKIKELKVWAKLDCDYFVQYRSSWVEIYDSELCKKYMECINSPEDTTQATDDEKQLIYSSYAILHIQMDLCLFTLKDALIKVKHELNIPDKAILTQTGYYIASEILIEILKSINFLHKQDPPIIHRDLKPLNILITNGSNGKFIRIADFGIATVHESLEESHTQLRGTFKYMAPEVLNGRKYDTKADVYSIGVITQEIFNIDINK